PANRPPGAPVRGHLERKIMGKLQILLKSGSHFLPYFLDRKNRRLYNDYDIFRLKETAKAKEGEKNGKDKDDIGRFQKVQGGREKVQLCHGI
ncbi:MAG: hypothetical protein Q4C22_05615, partial [Bacillota bacterium]|nr:hypothetical protein [Bacillota bacterium]